MEGIVKAAMIGQEAAAARQRILIPLANRHRGNSTSRVYLDDWLFATLGLQAPSTSVLQRMGMRLRLAVAVALSQHSDSLTISHRVPNAPV